MKHELVVAHYNERLDWLPEGFQATIYAKGKPHNGSAVLPNIGREGHTFVYHIVSNWNKLADLTTFVQGNPLDHCRTLAERITEEVEWFSWMTDMVFECNADGSPNWDQDVGSWYQDLTGKPFPPKGKIPFGVGGQFSATRECLQSIPLRKWRWILEQAETNPLFPWMMERTWGALLEKQNDCTTPDSRS